MYVRCLVTMFELLNFSILRFRYIAYNQHFSLVHLPSWIIFFHCGCLWFWVCLPDKGYMQYYCRIWPKLGVLESSFWSSHNLKSELDLTRIVLFCRSYWGRLGGGRWRFQLCYRPGQAHSLWIRWLFWYLCCRWALDRQTINGVCLGKLTLFIDQDIRFRPSKHLVTTQNTLQPHSSTQYFGSKLFFQQVLDFWI